ncbi:MAG TPA: hypothetical protein VGD34_12530 [Kribbella sp.]|jgi:hypothetical protein
MSENEDQSPYGRGFVAACIVIGVILLCGAVLLITGLTSPSVDPTAATGPATGAATPSEASGTPDPGGGGSTDPAPAVDRVGCRLRDGEQAIPLRAPAVDGWDVSRRVVVPRSAAYGPAKVDPDGFRRCFAHSPTGAVFAAYSAVAAIADQRKAVATVTKLMLPGPDADALLGELRKETPTNNTAPTQIAGYRVIDASRDRATVTLAMPVETAFMSATFTLVWLDGDWRLVPPVPGEPVGAPFAQQRDLAGFVPWSGV